MLKKLTDLAKSEKGKEFAEKATAKAKQMANDPQTREKIDAAKKRFNDKVGGDKPAGEADKTATDGSASGPAPTSTTGAPVSPEARGAAEPPDSRPAEPPDSKPAEPPDGKAAAEPPDTGDGRKAA